MIAIRNYKGNLSNGQMIGYNEDCDFSDMHIIGVSFLLGNSFLRSVNRIDCECAKKGDKRAEWD